MPSNASGMIFGHVLVIIRVFETGKLKGDFVTRLLVYTI